MSLVSFSQELGFVLVLKVLQISGFVTQQLAEVDYYKSEIDDFMQHRQENS